VNHRASGPWRRRWFAYRTSLSGAQHRTSLPSGLVRTSLRGAGTAPVFRLLRTASETESPGHRFAESATSASFFKTGVQVVALEYPGGRVRTTS
jgi:hypothetical protein